MNMNTVASAVQLTELPWVPKRIIGHGKSRPKDTHRYVRQREPYQCRNELAYHMMVIPSPLNRVLPNTDHVRMPLL